MKVVVTGATGFTGSFVVPLLQQRYQVRCLIRRSSDTSMISRNRMELFEGDLNDYSSLIRAFEGVDALVNLASLGFGHARNIVDACISIGCKRAVFLSTTAIFTRLNAASKAARLEAEDCIKNSGLNYTILRPTMIYGSNRDRNMCRLIRFMRISPYVFVPGTGENLQQPVYVEDVASAVVEAIANPRTYRNCYNIPGAKPITFNEVVATISSLLGKRTRLIPVPLKLVLMAVDALESYSCRLPIKAEQIRRLAEDKVFDFNEASSDFGYSPRPFKDGINRQIEQMNRHDNIS